MPATRSSSTNAAPSAAHTGIVRIHAPTMRRVTPHDTALRRVVAPAPMIELVMQCVVEVGSPKWLAVSSTTAARRRPCGSGMPPA